MNKEEAVEEFKRRSVQAQGILNEFYSGEKLNRLGLIAKGKIAADKENRRRIKRDLDILRFEMIDLIKATKRFKRLF